MNSYRVRTLVRCCFVAAVGLTASWIGINSGLGEKRLSLIYKAKVAGDRVAGLDGTSPQRFVNSPRPGSAPLPGRSRKSACVEFILNRRLDTNCVETMWKSKLIKEQDLTERDLKVREQPDETGQNVGSRADSLRQTGFRHRSRQE